MKMSHQHACACPGCLAGPRAEDRGAGPGLAGEAQAAKPVLAKEGIIAALTTVGGHDNSVAWNGAVVSYSIGTGSVSPGHPEWGPEHGGYAAISPAMKRAAAEAFELWDDVVAISLVELSGNPGANISFNYSAATDGGTYAKYSYYLTGGRADHTMADADLWFATDWSTHDTDADLYQGGYGVMTYLHEIGHGLGLSHPGYYNFQASFAADATHFQDTRAYTVMSYFDAHENGSGMDHVGEAGRRYAATPLLNDILVAQSIYGADMTTRTGATTYGFGSNAGRDAFDFVKNPDPVVAIWDAGGVDTIDVSGWNTNQVVDLWDGAFSSVGHLTHNLAIASGTVIENAIMGGGDDLLIGNAASNLLRGGAGDDRIHGGPGSDTIAAGAGDDSVFGGSGSDTFALGRSDLRKLSIVDYGGPSSSGTIIGPEGSDVLSEIETIQFRDGRLAFDVHSAEATVFRMYRAAFQRDPDSIGLNGRVAHLETGMTVDQMATVFEASEEFQRKSGSLSDQDFVRHLYRDALGREGEEGGIAFWTSSLDQGTVTRGQVLRAFAQCDEHIARTRSAVDQGIWNQDEAAALVARLYDAALDRIPDADGLVTWLDRLSDGFSFARVAEEFVASTEFQTRCGALANEDFVEGLYNDALDRNSDSGGKAFWLAALDSGAMDRSDVVLAFAQSFEHQLKTAWLVDEGTMIL